MSMSTEERCHSSNLIPSNQHLGFWVPKEAAYVRCRNQDCGSEKCTVRFKVNSHPAKLMPAIPFAKTILIPTAICSHVPRLSPVHIAPNLCEPAKNERERTKGRVGEFVLAAMAL